MQEIISYPQLTKQYQDVSTFLFDMDGTVMNTEVIHARAINQIIHEQVGIELELSKLELMCIGLTDEVVYEKLISDKLVKDLDLTSFLSRKKELFTEILVDIDPSEIFNEKVRSLLENISQNKNLALVTSSEKDTTIQLLEFLNIKHLFRLIITREDTSLNKPHPEPYLHAMKELQVESNACLIFEDSVPGRTAALNSGAKLFEVSWYA